jgi:hypothetical protein
MAIGWLAVLKMVPWGDVIENAPKVAQGAKKLWHTVGKKNLEPPAPASTGPLQTQAPSLAALQAQVAELQSATSDLQQQMLESSALIESLAEQNTQLIQRVEINRRRVIWLAGALVGLAVLVMVKLFW